MILGYAIVCSAVAAMLQVVGEMTIAFPTSGNFIDYADRFVDPALAFAAGFAEWLGNFQAAPRSGHPMLIFIAIRLDSRHRLRSRNVQDDSELLGCWIST